MKKQYVLTLSEQNPCYNDIGTFPGNDALRPAFQSVAFLPQYFFRFPQKGPHSVTRPYLLVLATLSLVAALPAQAQTVITGHHDSNPTPPGNGDGYDASLGSFVVSADTGTALDATFSNNSQTGLVVGNGGTVSGVATALVSGGTFMGNYVGLRSIDGGAVTVTGGTFGSNFFDFLALSANSAPGTIDVYGSFLDPTTGQPLLPGQTITFGQFNSGSFTGTLANNTVSRTYTYADYRSAVTLHDVVLAPAPEPSAWAAFAVGLLGLSALSVTARKRARA